MAVKLIKGDITQLKVDAIVNAANNSLLGGGGVDGAIHQNAGPELLEECKTLGGCATGEAKLTKGYNLPARFVIHTVGPVWEGGHKREPELLESAYRSSLSIAMEKKLTSIAFPNISTGVYGFPKDLAAGIAYNSVMRFLDHSRMDIYFVCFDQENYDIYKTLIH